MLAELIQTFPVHVFEHAGGTACHLPPFFQTLHLALAVRLGFAVHVVVIVRFAACANEEGGTEERSGGGADFCDLGEGVGKGGGVEEDLLVESVAKVMLDRGPF